MPLTNCWQGKKKAKEMNLSLEKVIITGKRKVRKRKGGTGGGGGNSNSLLIMMTSLLVMPNTPEIQ